MLYLFMNNFNYEIINNELSDKSGIEKGKCHNFGLDTSTLIPYTLFILKNVNDEYERNELFSVIESFIMRRMVVKGNNKNYNQFFTERLIGNKILSKPQFLEFLEKRNDKINFLPNNDELKEGLKNRF